MVTFWRFLEWRFLSILIGVFTDCTESPWTLKSGFSHHNLTMIIVRHLPKQVAVTKLSVWFNSRAYSRAQRISGQGCRQEVYDTDCVAYPNTCSQSALVTKPQFSTGHIWSPSLISQPPFQLGRALWLSFSQWNISGSTLWDLQKVSFKREGEGIPWRSRDSNAGGMGSIPGQGIKILQVAKRGQNNNNNNNNKFKNNNKIKGRGRYMPKATQPVSSEAGIQMPNCVAPLHPKGVAKSCEPSRAELGKLRPES